MQRAVLLLGANADMAESMARHFAQRGYQLLLASRNTEKLASLESDLKIRYDADVQVFRFDANDYPSHHAFYHSLPVKPDVVVVAFGVLGDTEMAMGDWNSSQEIISANFTGAVSIVNVVALDFQQRQAGTIVGISSVAGERGRQSNFIYGSAKAGFTAYLSGLRNRLTRHKVHVVTVKPGFVRTKMIADVPTPVLLTATPDQVAKRIDRAIQKRKNVIYVLPVWRYIMLVIKLIPEFIFKKLSL
ncbi:MAG: SDR family oxidoreductase [Cyclobacteriaceae bacterium]|nr:SDR family oxidoreductase [Cyclobacteriaceae bacterium]